MALTSLCYLYLCLLKTFFITIIEKTLDLAFNHFFPCYFIDLDMSGRRGRIGILSVKNKGGFVVLGGDNLLGFLGSLSSFQPSLRVSH
jgi:hypothetical protein